MDEQAELISLYNSIFRVVKKINKDKEHYPEAKNMINKLKWVNFQIITRITDELFPDKNDP